MKYASSPLTANKKGIPTEKHILAFRLVALAAALIGLSTALRAAELKAAKSVKGAIVVDSYGKVADALLK